jgi:hypothetical protein
MATTTPNYGWTVPTSTDLVKDGATAIETLGDAIDASLVDLRGGTTGQVLKKASATQMDFEWGSAASGLTLINTTTFSNVSSVSLPTGTFTSTYDNYRVITDFRGLSSDGDGSLRVRASGTDLTTSTYKYGRTYLGAYSAVAFGSENGISGTSINIGSVTTVAGRGGNFGIDVHAPMLATATGIQSWGVGNAVGFTGCIVDNTTAYDSLTFFLSGNNITGTIRVYGYQNS